MLHAHPVDYLELHKRGGVDTRIHIVDRPVALLMVAVVELVGKANMVVIILAVLVVLV